MRKLFLILLVIFAVFVFINANATNGPGKAGTVDPANNAIMKP